MRGDVVEDKCVIDGIFSQRSPLKVGVAKVTKIMDGES